MKNKYDINRFVAKLGEAKCLSEPQKEKLSVMADICNTMEYGNTDYINFDAVSIPAILEAIDCLGNLIDGDNINKANPLASAMKVENLEYTISKMHSILAFTEEDIF